jgi:hypothetical protein
VVAALIRPFVERLPKKENSPAQTDIASDYADHGHGYALLMRSPCSDLFTGTMLYSSTTRRTHLGLADGLKE